MMAGVSPLLIASIGAGVATGAQAISQASAPSAADSGAASAYQNRVDELNAKAAAEERSRQASYKKLSAQQRARFAARGLSPAGGSSAAVLEGLKTMYEAEASDRARQISIQRDRAALSLPQQLGTDLLAKKSTLVQDNLGKLMLWD